MSEKMMSLRDAAKAAVAVLREAERKRSEALDAQYGSALSGIEASAEALEGELVSLRGRCLGIEAERQTLDAENAALKAKVESAVATLLDGRRPVMTCASSAMVTVPAAAAPPPGPPMPEMPKWISADPPSISYIALLRKAVHDGIRLACVCEGEFAKAYAARATALLEGK